jgi:hypothetical protein
MKMILTKSGKTLILSQPDSQPIPVLQLTNEPEAECPWDDQDITA